MLVCAQTEMMQRFLSTWGPNLQEDKPPVFVGTGRTIGGFRRSSSGSRSLSLVITPELRPLGFTTVCFEVWSGLKSSQFHASVCEFVGGFL